MFSDINSHISTNIIAESKNTETDSITKVESTIKYSYPNFSLQTSYFSNIILGYYSDSSWGIEAEMVSNNYYFTQSKNISKNVKEEDKVIKDIIDSTSLQNSSVNTFYMVFNARYDIFKVYRNKLALYIKGGIGIGIFDKPNKNTPSTGGIKPSFTYQGVVGINYDINSMISLSLGYKYLANVERKRYYSSTSLVQNYLFTQSAFQLGFKLKLFGV